MAAHRAVFFAKKINITIMLTQRLTLVFNWHVKSTAVLRKCSDTGKDRGRLERQRA